MIERIKEDGSHGSHEVVPTGIPGLDDILRGGFPRGHLYLVEGDAGAGKTTLGLQFLMNGRDQGEKTLWCTLSETEQQLQMIARSHGWDLQGIEICNLARSEASLKAEDQYSFFSPADVELGDIIKSIMEVVDRVKPTRVVFDPFTDIRLLARDPLRYRRQVLALREFFMEIGSTVLLLQERSLGSAADLSAEGVVQGLIILYQNAPDYGGQRRRLRVHKLRGVAYRDGFHDVAIHTGGLVVYPRLVASEHYERMQIETLSTGVAELDRLLGGGYDRGSSVLIMGPAGVGKSTLASQFAIASAKRGERAAAYIFDESVRAFVTRARGLGLPVEDVLQDGRLTVRTVNPAEFTPGEFAHEILKRVDDDGIKLVVIDSLSGYLANMPGEQFLSMHLHELLSYLGHKNVNAVLTLNQHGIMGDAVHSPVEISYLADTALLLRYFEAFGEVRRSVAAVKRRFGPHEVNIRELTVDSSGIRLGQALKEFHGVLTGQPSYTGVSAELSTSRNVDSPDEGRGRGSR